MYLTELYLVSPSEAYSTKEHLSPPRFVSCCRFRGLPSAVPKTCFHISFSRSFPDVFDRPVPIVLSIAAVQLNRQSRAIGRKGRRRQTERDFSRCFWSPCSYSFVYSCSTSKSPVTSNRPKRTTKADWAWRGINYFFLSKLQNGC